MYGFAPSSLPVSRPWLFTVCCLPLTCGCWTFSSRRSPRDARALLLFCCSVAGCSLFFVFCFFQFSWLVFQTPGAHHYCLALFVVVRGSCRVSFYPGFIVFVLSTPGFSSRLFDPLRVRFSTTAGGAEEECKVMPMQLQYRAAPATYCCGTPSRRMSSQP